MERKPAKALTEDQAAVAREAYQSGETMRSLASNFGVSLTEVYQVIHGNKAPTTAKQPRQKKQHPTMRQLSDLDIRQLREDCDAGHSQRSMAKKYGISTGMVSLLVRGLRRVDAGGFIRTTPAKGRGIRLFDAETVVQIRKERAAGASTVALGKKYNCYSADISRVINGNTYCEAGGPTFKVPPAAYALDILGAGVLLSIGVDLGNDEALADRLHIGTAQVARLKQLPPEPMSLERAVQILTAGSMSRDSIMSALGVSKQTIDVARRKMKGEQDNGD